MYRSTYSGTRCWMGVDSQRNAQAALASRKTPGNHFSESWVGPRSCLNLCGSSNPRRVSNPETFNPQHFAIPTELFQPPVFHKGRGISLTAE